MSKALNRSIAGQIEYWAKIGKEESGLKRNES